MSKKNDSYFEVSDAIDIIENCISNYIQLERNKDSNLIKFLVNMIIFLIICILIFFAVDKFYSYLFFNFLPLAIVPLYIGFDKLRLFVKLKTDLKYEKKYIKNNILKINPLIDHFLEDSNVSPLSKIFVEAKKEYLLARAELMQ